MSETDDWFTAPYFLTVLKNIHPPHHNIILLEESNFNLWYVRLCDLDISREKKMLKYLQTAQNLIGHYVFYHMRVCTNWQLPLWRTPH